VQQAEQAARSDPQTTQQIISTNPQAVTAISREYGVSMEAAAILLLWQMIGNGIDEPWRRHLPPALFAEGGRTKKKKKDDDEIALEPQFYVPNDPKGTKTWPKAPDPEVRGGYTSVGREMMRQQREEWEANRRGYNVPKRLFETLGLRINPQNWDNFIANAPRSTNIEDRRFSDPTRDETVGGAGYDEGGRVYFQEGGRAMRLPGVPGYGPGGMVGGDAPPPEAPPEDLAITAPGGTGTVPRDSFAGGFGPFSPDVANSHYPAEMLQPVPGQGFFQATGGPTGRGGRPNFQPVTTVPGIPGGGFWTAADRAIERGTFFGDDAGPGGQQPQGGHIEPNWSGLFGGRQAYMPSTDNWRLLPSGYNNPAFRMRHGHIINAKEAEFPGWYLANRGSEWPVVYRGGTDFPAASGMFQADYGLFWPGQIEPWEYSQGMKGARGGRIEAPWNV